MMSKLKLNYYRAEDEMLIMERIQWRKEEEERKKERKRAEKELAKLRATKNKEWREKREEARNKQMQTVIEEEDMFSTDHDVEEALRNELKCPVCGIWMLPPSPIYQCEDGHVLCYKCKNLPDMKECPTCMAQIVGRNTLVENVAAIVFSKDVEHQNLEEEKMK